MSFETLGLKPELLRAVADKGYTVPTPIQLEAIPAVLSGRDVLAGAQTGTGKTAGFTLPLLQKLGARGARNPRALVLTPTRELAAQVEQSVKDYGKYVDLRSLAIFGGVSEKPQIDKLRFGCDILVATPGRLLDLCEQRAVSLAEVQIFMLDEADRMLDMGFIRDIRRVLKMLPAQRQNLMFSATYSDDIRDLANRFVKNPLSLQVTPRNATAEKVEQSAYRVPKEHKRHLLAHLIHEGNWHQVLVFTRTKHGANRLTQQLERAGVKAMAIHGNKSQNARVRALEDFKENTITALVATEVAARGLDIKELPHVVNYELPNVPEDYVHRIGRTARAGSTGAAISLVSPDEVSLLGTSKKCSSARWSSRRRRSLKSRKVRIPRARERRAGEYQPHQDPRRRPEHRGPRGQQGGRGGHGGQRHKPGTATHDAYLRDAGGSAAAGDRPQQPGAERNPGGEKRPHAPRRQGGGQQRSAGQQQGGHKGGHQGGGNGHGAPRGDRNGASRGASRGQRSGFARGARSSGGTNRGGTGGGSGGSSGGSSGGFSRMN